MTPPHSETLGSAYSMWLLEEQPTKTRRLLIRMQPIPTLRYSFRDCLGIGCFCLIRIGSFCLIQNVSPLRSNMAASAPPRELLEEVVRAVLHSWPVLQIAVDNGFGGVYGQQKADWMVDVVQQYFHDNADLQQSEVEDFVSQLMDQEFDTVVDDGSLPQVCDSLIQAFSQWQQGALQQLKHTVNTLTQKRSQRAKVTAPPTQSDDSSDEPQMMECDSSAPSASSTEPPPPADGEPGWTVVRKRK
ncbi:pre-rRNA-processing protein TSR2 homolog [Spinachia spinachia]